MSRSIPTEELETIRAADAAAGDDLQLCPVAWQQRRRLLQAHDTAEEVFTDHDRLVRELDVLLNGSGAAQQARLCDIVSQIQRLPTAWILPDGSISMDPDFHPHAEFLTGPMRCRRIRYIVEDTAP